MAKNTTGIRVPYSRTGDLQHYPIGEYDYTKPHGRQDDGTYIPTTKIEPDWRPNTPFTATLHLLGTIRGRSAAYFEWADDEGHRYPMFISDVAGLLQSSAHVDAGRITATWIAQKRGANYGIRLATLDELAAATKQLQAANAGAAQ